jgi:ribosomal protein S25
MLKEVPKILCVTRSMLIEKFKVGGSIARALIKDLSK